MSTYTSSIKHNWMTTHFKYKAFRQACETVCNKSEQVISENSLFQAQESYFGLTLPAIGTFESHQSNLNKITVIIKTI